MNLDGGASVYGLKSDPRIGNALLKFNINLIIPKSGNTHECICARGLMVTTLLPLFNQYQVCSTLISYNCKVRLSEKTPWYTF